MIELVIGIFNFCGGMFFCHVINPTLVLLYYVLFRGESKWGISKGLRKLKDGNRMK